MAGEWRDAVLSDLVAIQRGHDLTESERRPGSVPVLGSAGQNGFHDTALAPGPGVVIGRSGASFGQVTYCETAYWPHNTVLYVTNFRGNNPRFVYYCLKAMDFSRYNSGSAQQSLNRNYIYSAPLRIPDVQTQHVIAHVLGTLDDKIDLNRRMSETLEAMARALFKSWFVDFDPVRAKMEGRWRKGESLPGLPAHLYDLFPDRLVDSEMGQIPEGWKVGALEHVAVHCRRIVQPEQISPNTPYIALEHMPRRCITLSDWSTSDGLESSKCRFERGEILFGKLRPYFHKVGVAPINGVCSTDIVVVAPRSREWFGFVLGHVSSVPFVEYTNAGSTGTKMPRTSWADMARYEVMLPQPAVAAAFTRLIRPLVERIIAGIHESRALAALRDTLLPKLICGDIRVRDAAAFLDSGSTKLAEARI